MKDKKGVYVDFYPPEAWMPEGLHKAYLAYLDSIAKERERLVWEELKKAQAAPSQEL
jgi:hypothetical protein